VGRVMAGLSGVDATLTDVVLGVVRTAAFRQRRGGGE
jgi:hypothetical protein